MTQEPTPRLALDFPATLAGFERGFAELRSGLGRESLTPAARYNVELVFEEIVANIVRYGAQGRVVDVRVTLDRNDASIAITFDDDGVPFDPTKRPDPTPAKSLADASIGGRGIMLVRRIASAIDYSRTPEQRNRLVVTLPLPAASIEQEHASQRQ
jgi:anti-sigma regulatory factor (Ser/Thr protein kinase)